MKSYKSKGGRRQAREGAGGGVVGKFHISFYNSDHTSQGGNLILL